MQLHLAIRITCSVTFTVDPALKSMYKSLSTAADISNSGIIFTLQSIHRHEELSSLHYRVYIDMKRYHLYTTEYTDT